MNFSRTERTLHAVAVVAIVILILIILSGQIVKGSGPAEWLSALLNLVMAVAAVMAFFTARSWLPQLTTQEGYKLAIRLVNELFITLGDRNELSTRVWSVHQHAELAFEEIKGEAAAKKLTDSIAKLEEQLGMNLKNRTEIERVLFQIETYGLQVGDEKKEAMQDMLLAHKETISLGQSLRDSIKDYVTKLLNELPFAADAKREQQSKIKNDDCRMVLYLQSQCESVQKKWKQMKDAQAAFIGDDHRIGKLFIVRKG